MRAILKATQHSLTRTLVSLLTAMLFVSVAHAQSTNAETNLAYVLASDVSGGIVTCPSGYPITDLAVCFEVSASLDLTSLRLDNSVNQYGDARWEVPWVYSDPRDVKSRYLTVTGHPMFAIFLTNTYGSDYRTVVWVIESDRFPN